MVTALAWPTFLVSNTALAPPMFTVSASPATTPLGWAAPSSVAVRVPS